jgi:hypothetical protein
MLEGAGVGLDRLYWPANGCSSGDWSGVRNIGNMQELHWMQTVHWTSGTAVLMEEHWVATGWNSFPELLLETFGKVLEQHWMGCWMQ